MKLILMTTPYFFVEEHQIINALFDEGLEILHLRKPETEPVYSERLLTLINENYRKRIVVHDHFYLKNEYNLKGIHLNYRNPELPLKYKGHISCTCHTEQEIMAHKKACDYVFLSPIFNVQGNGAYSAEFQPSVLRSMASRKIIDRKVMAFGGVNLDNIAQVKSLGFGGAVILGDIWNRFSIHSTQDFKGVIQHFRKLRKAAD
ncbi:MAG: thiamine phosphate synthase [Prevotella sp.]|nr:thiamine phosphate synthase [Prevotella sp.]MDY5665792.1 thiamine phosphate synthase [Alloprevotella sp.]